MAEYEKKVYALVAILFTFTGDSMYVIGIVYTHVWM